MFDELDWPSLEARSPPCFSFTRFIVEQFLLIKTRIWPLHTVWKLPGHHRRHQTYSNALKYSLSPELVHIGVVCLLLWPIHSHRGVYGTPHLSKIKLAKCFCAFFLLFCFFSIPWRNAHLRAKPVLIDRKKKEITLPANIGETDQTSSFVASHLGLHCVSLCNKNDAMLKCI